MKFEPKAKYDMFIDGKFVPAQSGKYFTSINPATGKPLAEVAYGDRLDVDTAVKAAWKAYPAWAKKSPMERSDILWKIAEIIDVNAELLAQAETMDNGKPLGESQGDLGDAADQFRYFAGCVRAEEGAYVPYNEKSFSLLIKEPMGVVGQIVPWNFPLSMGSWKLAPALAAGNCIVFKPASNTSISILVLADLLKDVLPPGVLNIVTGSGSVCGEAVISHPDIRKVAFTGSTEVGRRIGKVAGERIIPATLELGGKSANIVFPDCQWERTLIGACVGILFNQGQVCCAGSRLFVHEDIYSRFVSDLVKKFQTVKVGNGLNPETKMGPIIDENQLKKILNYIEIGNKEGAKLACGGNQLTGPGYDGGYFVEPTMFIDVDNKMRIAQEEIFGPVLAVIKFKDEQEVINMANDSTYGLAGAVWTQDINRAIRVAKAVEAGTMWVNEFGPTPAGCAFGGYKGSGYNREVNKEILNCYSQVKNIFVQMEEESNGYY